MAISFGLATIVPVDSRAKQILIRDRILANETSLGKDFVLWSRHAVAKLVTEKLDRVQVERALATCEIIEEYPVLSRPLPDCLVLAWLGNHEPIHVTLAIDEPNDRILIVTVYRPTAERWGNDWRTRK